MVGDSSSAPGSFGDQAYDVLRGEILGGALAPGTRLRPQALQEQYGLGLTPLREALMRLEVAGLVQGHSQKGFRVTEATGSDLADLTRTRCAIERLCLTEAIAHGDTDWEAEIVAAYHALSRTKLPQSPADRGAAELWEIRHRRFHAALVAACRSDWLLRFWRVLADHSERYRQLRLVNRDRAAAGVRDIDGEHAAIMRAVLDRDSETAMTLMDAHLAATAAAVLAVMEEGAAGAS